MSLVWQSPKSKEIATPACALVRNDRIFFCLPFFAPCGMMAKTMLEERP